jgi:hypothetical protein
MTRILAAAEVEAAANGHGEITLNDGVLVTPLARDRAAALGVRLVEGPHGRANSYRPPGPRPPGTSGVAVMATAISEGNGTMHADHLARLRAESAVRSAARRVLLRQGAGLAGLEDVMRAVLARLEVGGGRPGCTCTSAGRSKPGGW